MVTRRFRRRNWIASLVAIALLPLVFGSSSAAEKTPADGRYLYVVCPGIRNYLEFGGAGVLVFDIDHNHKFVRRIDTPASKAAKPDNVKGVCAHPATNRLYFTTTKTLYCLDLTTGQPVWDTTPPNGTDRMSITPDGRVLYVPSFEKDTWNVIDATTGKLVT